MGANKRIFSVILLMCTSLIYLSGCSPKKDIVTIYSTAEEYRNEAYKNAINKLYPDIELNIIASSTGKTAARVVAEGENTEADIILGLSSAHAYNIKRLGIVQPYTTNNIYVDEMTDSDSIVLPIACSSGVFLINMTELEANNLPIPESYEDLTNPVYKNYIAMPNPSSSTTGFFFLAGLYNLYGEEYWMNYISSLIENVKFFSESGSGATNMVLSGEIPIALGMDFDGIKNMAEKPFIKVVFPKEGSPYDFDSAMLVKKDRDIRDSVLKVMEFIVSEEGLELSRQHLFIPVIQGDTINQKDYPADFKLLDMTNLQDSDYRQKIFDIWDVLYEQNTKT